MTQFDKFILWDPLPPHSAYLPLLVAFKTIAEKRMDACERVTEVFADQG